MKPFKVDLISQGMREKGLTFRQLSEKSGISESQLYVIVKDVVEANAKPRTLKSICPHVGIKEEDYWMIYAGSKDFVRKEDIDEIKKEYQMKMDKLNNKIDVLKDENMDLMRQIIAQK